VTELVERSVRDAGAISYGLEASEQVTDSAAIRVAKDPLRLSRVLFQQPYQVCRRRDDSFLIVFWRKSLFIITRDFQNAAIQIEVRPG